ncbi:hypothetical protein ZIOFF_003262 [Zingiber officinale]|uniref:RING-type domain-containing protein n=1 Tax=Zingiber officinale TaxID=94328 RepID=A0A8J5HXH6_ZINOF|nr:hypothetical protein ZIOFF_003262 [Zingiber officinale]
MDPAASANSRRINADASVSNPPLVNQPPSMRPSPPTAASPVEGIVPVDLPPWIAISGGVELRVMARAHVRLDRLVPEPIASVPRLIVRFCRQTFPSPEHPGELVGFVIHQPFHLLMQQQAWERETQVMLVRVAANYVQRADLDLLAEAFRNYTSSAVRQLPMMSVVMMEIYSIIFVPNASLGVSRLQIWLPPEEFALLSQSEGRNNAHFDRGSRPASAAAVEGLKMVTVEEPDSCSICLEDFGTATPVLAMPCSHLFHVACLKKWLEQSCSCPLCRFSLPQEQRLNDL